MIMAAPRMSTTDTTSHSRGVERPSFARLLTLLKEKRAREAGRRLAPAIRGQEMHTG